MEYCGKKINISFNSKALLLSLFLLLNGYISGTPLIALPNISIPTKTADSEAHIKATYLYNLTRFVQWNSRSSFNHATPLTIGIAASDQIAAILSEITKSKKNEIAIRVLILDKYLSGLSACDMVYVGGSDKGLVKSVLKKTEHREILTVGDSRYFTRHGGMIGFCEEGGKIVLEVHVENAKKAKLNISAKLLEISRIANYD